MKAVRLHELGNRAALRVDDVPDPRPGPGEVILDLVAATGDPSVKEALRKNTEEAAQHGIYGVPSFLISDQIFWGDDMFDLMLEWLNNPSILDDPEVHRIMSLPSAAERKIK